MKIQNAIVSNILDRSQRYFAHVTTVTLSWRAQNIVVIGHVHFTLECFEFSSNFEFDRNMLSGTGAWSGMLTGVSWHCFRAPCLYIQTFQITMAFKTSRRSCQLSVFSPFIHFCWKLASLHKVNISIATMATYFHFIFGRQNVNSSYYMLEKKYFFRIYQGLSCLTTGLYFHWNICHILCLTSLPSCVWLIQKILLFV